jgi:glutamate-1-semialdehyde 2,1-aminomutase
MDQTSNRVDDKSKTAFAEAKNYIPGGVNSPVRAFKSVGLTPFFAEKGIGSRIFDIDGNSFIDYVGSWGPLILGHAHPQAREQALVPRLCWKLKWLS